MKANARSVRKGFFKTNSVFGTSVQTFVILALLSFRTNLLLIFLFFLLTWHL